MHIIFIMFSGIIRCFDSLSHNKILHLSINKAFEGNKFKVAKIMEPVFSNE